MHEDRLALPVGNATVSVTCVWLAAALTTVTCGKAK